MGSRRTHEQAAVACARAAYVAGFAGTSNLRAGQRWGLPTTGTSAHAFVLLHDGERAAFAAQVDALGEATTLLVDTYDVPTAVRTAVEVAGPGSVPCASTPATWCRWRSQVRAELDELGAKKTRIIVTGDLDEHAIAALRGVAGRRLRGGHRAGHRVGAADQRLRLQAGGALRRRRLRPAAGGQEQPAQADRGRPQVGRPPGRRQRHGTAEVVAVGGPPPDSRPLQVPMVRAGERVWDEPLAASRDRHRRSRAELPMDARHLSRGRARPPDPVPGGSDRDHRTGRCGRAERLLRGRLAGRRRRRLGRGPHRPAAGHRGPRRLPAGGRHPGPPHRPRRALLRRARLRRLLAPALRGRHARREFHDALQPRPFDAVFLKGEHEAAYSGFEGFTEGGGPWPTGCATTASMPSTCAASPPTTASGRPLSTRSGPGSTRPCCST